MINSFSEIDELTIHDHAFLCIEKDKCYYLFNYTARKGYSFSPTNDLIINLKKKPSTKNSPAYKYKITAINKVAGIFSENFSDSNLQNATFVPIPPSKNKTHIEYDDRISKILEIAFKNRNSDIRELVEQIESKEASHSSDVRPTIKELKDNLKINDALAQNLHDTIFLVDDVITTGAHFKAIKLLIQERFPNISIIGVFIARRAIDVEEDSD
jgi:predicted amidophosphoribosyltransferase